MGGVINALGQIKVTTFTPAARTVTADETLTPADMGGYIFANGTLTLTLPPALNVQFREIVIINVGAGSVVVAGNGGELVSGDASLVIAYRGSAARLVSTGAEWWLT